MSMNAGFQVTLDLDGRQCLVIGGDEEAVEKTTRLLDAGAKVTVVPSHVAWGFAKTDSFGENYSPWANLSFDGCSRCRVDFERFKGRSGFGQILT